MAKIIKGDPNAAPVSSGNATAPGGARRLIDAEVYDAGRQAKQIVAAAEEQARQIVEQANAERDRVHQEASEAGHQEGLAKVTALLVEAGRLRDKKIAELEHQVTRLAVKIAEKILGRELLLNDEAVVDVAAQALLTARQQKEISLRINPKDARVIRENQRRLIDQLSRAKQIEIREDEEVPRGGVLIETEVGVIDARLDVQLEMLKRVLEEAEES